MAAEVIGVLLASGSIATLAAGLFKTLYFDSHRKRNSVVKIKSSKGTLRTEISPEDLHEVVTVVKRLEVKPEEKTEPRAATS